MFLGSATQCCQESWWSAVFAPSPARECGVVRQRCDTSKTAWRQQGPQVIHEYLHSADDSSAGMGESHLVVVRSWGEIRPFFPQRAVQLPWPKRSGTMKHAELRSFWKLLTPHFWVRCPPDSAAVPIPCDWVGAWNGAGDAQWWSGLPTHCCRLAHCPLERAYGSCQAMVTTHAALPVGGRRCSKLCMMLRGGGGKKRW